MKNKKLFTGVAIVLACAVLIPVSKLGATSIGKNQAKTTAQKYVPSGSTYLTAKYDDGKYEVKFFNKQKKESYEVDIYASTGKVYSFESERVNNNGSTTVTVSEEEAQQKVKDELKDITILSTKLDYDDGLKEYKIHFSNDSYIGKYKINPKTGLILEREIKVRKTNINNNQSTSDTISTEKAKQIALDKVSGATIIKCKLDEDDGRWIYELELYKGNYEYELEIDAQTGTIIKYEKDYID